MHIRMRGVGTPGTPPTRRLPAISVVVDVRPFLDGLAALEDADVRYVVVGGVAVVLHGHPRLTVDLDLVLDLAPANVATALRVLTAEGLVPRLPVAAEGFADPTIRAGWVADRALTVFSLHDPSNPLREVDLFAQDPLPFEELWATARWWTSPTSTRWSASETIGRSAMADGRAVDWKRWWEELDRAQRRAWRTTTADERLRWLEEAHVFALESGALQRDRARRAAAAGSWAAGRAEQRPVGPLPGVRQVP
jgi:hypothetical protein